MGPFGSASPPDGSLLYRSSWYSDYAFYPYSTYPWFYRGGLWNAGTSSGIFAFGRNNGGVVSYVSFRIVLAP